MCFVDMAVLMSAVSSVLGAAGEEMEMLFFVGLRRVSF
jgi:hypothetical protein